MLEQETEQIIQLLIRRTIGQGAGVRMQDVLAARIPRGIKSYLRAEVTTWLGDELRQGRRMSGIVRAEPSAGGTASALLHSASLEYLFPRAEFVTTLDQAVHFLGNYLCRPQWTLRQFLTPGGTPVPTATVRQKLTYVSEYAYLGTLIEAYLESRRVAAISSAQLGALLEQIDRLMIQRGTFAGLARLAEPMFEFFALASPTQDEIPLKPVLVFLGDKNQQMLQDHLEQLGRSRGGTAITFGEFVRSMADLDDDARIHATLYAPPPEQPDTDEPRRESLAEAPGSTRAESPPATPEESEPRTAALPASLPQSSVHDGRNIPLSLTFAGMNGKEETLPPLDQCIKEEQRRFFIDALFGKDPASYVVVIEAMNRIPAWSEAAGYMRGLFESNGIDPLSDEALEFVEAVQLRYRSGRQ